MTVTPLRLDRPLAGLLELSASSDRKLSHRDLGELRQPMVSAAAVGDALRLGDAIKLSTLAAYARAAGYVLWLVAQGTHDGGKRWECQCGEMANGNPHPQRAECNYCAGELDLDICWCHAAEERDERFNYPPAAVVESLDVTVAGARALLRALGLEMTLAVEPERAAATPPAP